MNMQIDARGAAELPYKFELEKFVDHIGGGIQAPNDISKPNRPRGT
ncbi:hypothetical protein [Neorhizobium alkalisoli]|nr:hypothetical protein [Neorhizobium alkalisoli]